MKKISDIANGAVTRLLRPLARILLHHNVSFLTFIDLAKRVFVEVAEQDFPPNGRKQSVSRIAMLTGLSRKEVLRVKRILLPIDGEGVAQQERSTRVINGWMHDGRFLDDSGNPLMLDFDGPQASFSELVRIHPAPGRAGRSAPWNGGHWQRLLRSSREQGQLLADCFLSRGARHVERFNRHQCAASSARAHAGSVNILKGPVTPPARD